MKTLLFIVALMIGVSIQAQEYKLVDGKLVNTSVPKGKDSSVKTKYVITEKGVDYPVYQGAKGGYYIIKTSKKTGKEYRKYIKIEGI